MCRVCEEYAEKANDAAEEPRTLADYAAHLAYCDWYSGLTGTCTCGLDEVLERARRS